MHYLIWDHMDEYLVLRQSYLNLEEDPPSHSQSEIENLPLPSVKQHTLQQKQVITSFITKRQNHTP